MNKPHFLSNRDRIVSDPTLRALRTSKRRGIRGMGFFSPRVMGASGNLSHCPSPVPTPTHRGAPSFGMNAAAASTPMKKALGGLEGRGTATTRVYTKSDRASFLAAERERNHEHILFSLAQPLSPPLIYHPTHPLTPSNTSFTTDNISCSRM